MLWIVDFKSMVCHLSLLVVCVVARLRFCVPSVQQSESQIVFGELQRVAGGRGELEWT